MACTQQVGGTQETTKGAALFQVCYLLNSTCSCFEETKGDREGGKGYRDTMFFTNRIIMSKGGEERAP